MDPDQGFPPRLPPPDKFNPSKMLVREWLFKLELWFQATRTPRNQWIDQAVLLLEGTALTWWMHLHSQHAQPRYWNVFVLDITETFLSINDTRQARDSLERLTQTGSVSDYIAKFTHLLFRIGDISESETYYTFKKGLKHHVKIKMDDLDIQYNPGDDSLRTLQRAAQ